MLIGFLWKYDLQVNGLYYNYHHHNTVRHLYCKQGIDNDHVHAQVEPYDRKKDIVEVALLKIKICLEIYGNLYQQICFQFIKSIKKATPTGMTFFADLDFPSFVFLFLNLLFILF